MKKDQAPAKTDGAKVPAQLPALSDFDMSPEEAASVDKFNAYVNQETPASFIENHPLLKDKQGNALKYIPIDKVEFLLTAIFQQWYVEIIDVGSLFNSVYCTIRLHYRHRVTGEWLYQDGVGAQGMQTDKDARASDMSAIKQNAVTMGLPAAKSYAIKDAADHLGRMFGKDLNRKDTIPFTMERASYSHIFENNGVS